MYVTAANPVGDICNGSTFMHYELSVGSMSTVEGYTGPHIEGQVVNAGDWLDIDPSREHASVKVKGVVKAVSGASVYFSWTGHVSLDDDIEAVFQQAPDAKTTPFGKLTTLNSFKVGDPSLKSLGATCFVGSGRYIFRNGQMGIENRIARLVALSCDE
jgi:Protein of unknown function (DUF3237)